MLNDVPPEKRLAYMLGPTLDRHRGGSSLSHRAARLGFWGAGALVLLVLWELLQRY
jgi:hypothetical protein